MIDTVFFVCSVLFVSGCKNIKTEPSEIKGKVFHYQCEDVDLVYHPKDSLKIYIYQSFFKSKFYDKEDIGISPIYFDSLIVNLFLSGQISFENMWNSKTFEIKNKRSISRKTDDCRSIIPDSGMKVIELMQTNIRRDENGDIIRSFQTVSEYGTVHNCFELFEIGDRKYMIRFVGSIL